MTNKKKADQKASPNKTRPHDINIAAALTNAQTKAALIPAYQEREGQQSFLVIDYASSASALLIPRA